MHTPHDQEGGPMKTFGLIVTIIGAATLAYSLVKLVSYLEGEHERTDLHH